MNNYNYRRLHPFYPGEDKMATFQKNLIIASFNQAVEERAPREALKTMHHQSLKVIAECNKVLGIRADDGMFSLKSWS